MKVANDARTLGVSSDIESTPNKVTTDKKKTKLMPVKSNQFDS